MVARFRITKNYFGSVGQPHYDTVGTVFQPTNHILLLHNTPTTHDVIGRLIRMSCPVVTRDAKDWIGNRPGHQHRPWNQCSTGTYRAPYKALCGVSMILAHDGKLLLSPLICLLLSILTEAIEMLPPVPVLVLFTVMANFWYHRHLMFIN
jgi:hypothetical protein